MQSQKTFGTRFVLATAIASSIVVAGAGCARYSDADAEATRAAAPAQKPTATATLASLTDERIEVGCGMCIYGMADVNSCETAAMVAGKPVLVVGSNVNAHEHGLCTAAAMAVVTGSMKDGELVVSKLEVE